MTALLPLLVPLTTALLCSFAQGRPLVQQVVSTVGAVATLLAAIALMSEVINVGVVSVAIGNWPLPFAIEFAVDRLGACFALLAALMSLIVVIWHWSGVDGAPPSAVFHPLLHGLVAGAGAAFVTADLFNLYVWFEVALICSLGLLAHGGTARQLDAALKYFALNVVGTLLFLAAVALLYGVTGQLNFAALGAALAQHDQSVTLPLLGLLLVAFLIKAAAFPFFAWLPASYHTLPAPLIALFSALLTKVGIYALLRCFGDVFVPAPSVLFAVLGWVAVLSMVVGVVGAAYHWDMRRILAFHSISQIGYILLAIALTSPAGNAAALFFALHHSVVKAGLFLVAGLVYFYTGSYDLRRSGGLYAARPWLGAIFAVFALSLIGIPPMSGFWGKYLIVRESLVQGAYVWAACALIVGALTLYSMTKIWMEAFWKSHAGSAPSAPGTVRVGPAYACVIALAAITLITGLAPAIFIDTVNDAVRTLGEAAP